MTCYNPLTAYISRIAHKSGKQKIVFKPESAEQLKNPIQIPCGQCIGCRLERSRQWAIRCEHEASLNIQNCFITLTYAKDPKTLVKKDLQLFFKRLRKAYNGRKIRYFACGEYGDRFERPHFHACIFGFDFNDKSIWKVSGDYKTYRSRELEKLWPHGHSLVGTLTFESAAYVARYCVKKVTGARADEHYNGLVPEFVQMSLKPGIGQEWFDKFSGDIYNYDRMIVRNGVECRPAKFYDKKFDLKQPERLQQLKEKRKEVANVNTKSHRRLKDLEKIATIKHSKLNRDFERLKGCLS